MTPEFNIAILLPTRGRAEMLERSVQSLISMAKDPDQIQLMLAFDNDDEVGTKHFEDTLQPWLDDHQVNYTAMSFDPLGYRLGSRNHELGWSIQAIGLPHSQSSSLQHLSHCTTQVVGSVGLSKSTPNF